jgi:hypothetical protein
MNMQPYISSVDGLFSMFVSCIIGPIHICPCSCTVTRTTYPQRTRTCYIRRVATLYHPEKQSCNTTPSSYLVEQHVKDTRCRHYYTNPQLYQCGPSAAKRWT